jgi:GNAT superfamily N-acetyltransferase
MICADLTLSQRLERAEGHACVQYGAARRRLTPERGADWLDHAGAYAAFDGPESPVTQSFGLGLFEPLTAPILDRFEEFFVSRGARAEHEVSPFAGIPALDLLCARGYRPIEVSNVLCRSIDPVFTAPPPAVKVRVIGPDESQVWGDVCVRGWSYGHPELEGFLRDIGAVATAREDSSCFLAEIDGTPGAAGVLCLHRGVALFGGSTTVPELRRRGLQTALLHERMRHAREQGCDLAMIVVAPGSDSQRNAERAGFRVAYTRTKWRQGAPPDSRISTF